EISLIGAENVFNSDQSSFNLEMHTGRTLSFKGQKKIGTLTQSTNSMTHSYTIQPIVSPCKSGYLQEKSLHFDNPVDHCFKNCEAICELLCNNIAVIRCAWCAKSLCIQDFFIVYHFCKEYVA
ncbi:hypothetical protein ALC62_07055, partial [Cyphomyrmex costatus]